MVDRRRYRVLIAGNRVVSELKNSAIAEITQDGVVFDVRGRPGLQDLRAWVEGPVRALWLMSRGALVLHASAVLTERGVVGYLGRAGSGKSTFVRVAVDHGSRFWTDDQLTVIPEGDGFAALRGPSRIRIRCGRGKRVVRMRVEKTDVAPPAELFVLKRDSSPTILGQGWTVGEELQGIRAARAVLSNLYLGEVVAQAFPALQRIALALAGRIPVKVLMIPDSVRRMRRTWTVGR